MAMSTPADLSSPADDVGEDVRGRPRVGVVKDGGDLIIGRVVDAETLLQKMLIDEGLEILRAFGAVGGHMISQLVGKILGRMRGVGEDARVPKVLRIRFSELWVVSADFPLKGDVYQQTYVSP